MNQTFNEWIEPKNQRPEEDKEVLVTYKYYDDIGLEIAKMKYEPYNDSYYWTTENDFLDYLLDTDILAWQPLPKPFMEGELK